MFGQFGFKKNPCNMRFMHYHSMHYDNFYCIIYLGPAFQIDSYPSKSFE